MVFFNCQQEIKVFRNYFMGIKMYEVYQRLLDEHGIKNSDVSKATGISNMTLSDWKRGKSTPKQDKLKLIAEYFDVSVDYLLTGKANNYTPEMAETDAIIISLSEDIKKYSIKMSKLSETDKKIIFNLIDRLSER